MLALRLRRMRPDTLLSLLLVAQPHDGDPHRASAVPDADSPPAERWHVLDAGSLRQPIPNRWCDRASRRSMATGAISTGTPLSKWPRMSAVSHHPGRRNLPLAQTPAARCAQRLSNDVKGRFQPSYSIESWLVSPPLRRWHFSTSMPAAARLLAGPANTTYNLPTATARALSPQHSKWHWKATLSRNGRGSAQFLSALCNSELWVASQLCRARRSHGLDSRLVLDCARALRVAINPPPLGS